MKIFTCLIAVVACLQVSAQCTPDPQYTAPGIYPDSATNLAPAFIGNMYDETMTALVPQDTTVIVFGTPQTFTIDSIVVSSVTGLPPNFDYVCSHPDCVFYGGNTGCLKIYSTSNPTIADTGRYNLKFVLTTYSFIQQTDTLDYYYIDIFDSTVMSNNDLAENKLKIFQNKPNPVSDITYFEYTLERSQRVHLTVTNILGSVVYQSQHNGKVGLNRIEFNAGDMKPGIYLYTIQTGVQAIGKKMLVE